MDIDNDNMPDVQLRKLVAIHRRILVLEMELANLTEQLTDEANNCFLVNDNGQFMPVQPSDAFYAALTNEVLRI